MKKVLKFLLSLIWFMLLVNVKAYELNYSDWSEEYPTSINQILIESEDRYLWYKEERINEEYVIRENINNRIVDYDDFIYSTWSEPSVDIISESEDVEVEEVYDGNEIYGFSFNNFTVSSGYFYYSEIEVINKNTNQRIELVYDTQYDFLFDYDKVTYKNIIRNTTIMFKEPQLKDDLVIYIYFKSDSIFNSLRFNYLSSDNNEIFYKTIPVYSTVVTINSNELNENLTTIVTKYKYRTKMYKVYEIKKVYEEDYYHYLDGYIKDESSKKMYYRYITNDFVYYYNGKVVSDINICIKSNCILLRFSKKEEVIDNNEVVENPKTFDNILYYYFLLTISIIFFLIMLHKMGINLVLSNRFKKIFN